MCQVVRMKISRVSLRDHTMAYENRYMGRVSWKFETEAFEDHVGESFHRMQLQLEWRKGQARCIKNTGLSPSLLLIKVSSTH